MFLRNGDLRAFDKKFNRRLVSLLRLSSTWEQPLLFKGRKWTSENPLRDVPCLAGAPVVMTVMTGHGHIFAGCLRLRWAPKERLFVV
jgi:hypothetical protein